MTRWFILICWTPLLLAQGDEIRTLLAKSEAMWNRGDLAGFTAYYEDAPTTTFIGREVVRGGTQAILERYQRRYPNRDAMGVLSFSEIEVRELAPGLALASGKYDLKRTSGRRRGCVGTVYAGGAKDAGWVENHPRSFVLSCYHNAHVSIRRLGAYLYDTDIRCRSPHKEMARTWRLLRRW
jgi:hypothetical protein